MRGAGKALNFPIAPILEELGFEHVPRVVGPRWAKVRCHFHGDRTASASVSEFGYNCHACERQGDAISILREEENLSFEDAVRRCQEITGIGDSPVQQSGWGDLKLPD